MIHPFCLSELRNVEPDTPLIACRIDATGTVVFVASRVASFRKDIAKLRLFRIVGDEEVEIRLKETPDRKLLATDSGSEWDGAEFHVRQPINDKELDSAQRILDRYQQA